MGAKKPNKGTTKSKSPGFEVPQQKKRLSPEHPPHEQRPAKTRATEKAADPYEFPEAGEVDLTALASITTKLGSKSGKDTVLKALKNAVGLLETAPQDAAQLGNQGHPAASALLTCASEHSDKDVKLYAALCLAYLLRIHAPETPFDNDEDLKEVIKLLIWALGRLALSSASTFQHCLSILQLFEQVKLHLLVTDLGSDLLNSLFSTLLNAINDDNADAIEYSALEVLCGLLEECDAAHEEDSAHCAGITDDMLTSLLSALISNNASLHRLAASVTRRCEPLLRSRLQSCCALLISQAPEEEGAPGKPEAVLGSGAASALQSRGMDVVYQVHKAVPQVLLPVLSKLGEELGSQDEGRRGAAMGLMLRMLMDADIDIAEHHPQLINLTLVRFKDISYNIRLRMIEAGPQLIAEALPPVAEQVLTQLVDRMSDHDERVRAAVVRALGAVGASDPAKLTHAAAQGLCQRVHDAKLSVRREAAAVAVNVFRNLALRLSKVGKVSDTVDTTLLCLPGHLARVSYSDADMRAAVNALMVDPGLMPARINSKAAARIWATMWLECGPGERQGLLNQLAFRATLAHEVQQLITIHRRLAAKGADGEGENHASLAHTATLLAGNVVTHLCLGSTSADSRTKAAEHLSQLLAVKDQRVLDRLAQLANVHSGLTERELHDLRKDLVQRVGSKSPLGTFTANLTAALMPWGCGPDVLCELAQLACPLNASATSKQAAMDEDEEGLASVDTAQETGPIPDQGPESLLGAAAGHLLTSLLSSKTTPAHALLACVVPHMGKVVLAVAPPQPDDHPVANGTVKGRARAPAGPKAKGGKGQQQSKAEESNVTPESAAACWAGLTPAGYAQLLVASKVLARSGVAYGRALRHGSSLGPLPPGLNTALHQLCLAGPPKVAAASVYALAALSQIPAGVTENGGAAAADGGSKERTSSTLALLKRLTGQMAGVLSDVSSQQEGDHLGPCCIAALHGLSAIGSVAPDVFVDVADQVVTLLQDTFLTLPDIAGAELTLPPRLAGPVEAAGASTGSGGAALLGSGPGGGGQAAGVPGKLPTALERGASHLIRAKAGAVRAIARGFVPETGTSSSAGKGLQEPVKRLVAVLEQLMDVDLDTSAMGSSGAEDDALIRLAAAEALLTLSVRYDSSIPASAYLACALTLQDPHMDVRSIFGVKLRKLVQGIMGAVMSRHTLGPTSSTALTAAGGWLPSKYAAALALAAVDPVAEAQAGAAKALRDYVTGKRRAVQRAAQQAVLSASAASKGGQGGNVKGSAAAAGGGGGAGAIHELPEFMLPFVLYLLATHPDFPVEVLAAAGVTLSGAAGARPSGQVVVALPAPPPAPHSGTDPAEGGEEEAAGVTASLKPFSSMLQFLLEPLLLAGGGAGGGERGHYPSGGRGHGQHQHQRGEEAAALLPTLLKVLRAVKSTQVAQADDSVSAGMRVLCDMASALARGIVVREQRSKQKGGGGDEDEGGDLLPPLPPEHPGEVLLPTRLLSNPGSQQRVRLHEGSHLPAGYTPALDPEVKAIALGLPPGGAHAPHPQKRKASGGSKGAAAGKRNAGEGGAQRKQHQGAKRRKQGGAGRPSRDEGSGQEGSGSEEEEGEGHSEEEDAERDQRRPQPKAKTQGKGKHKQKKGSGQVRSKAEAPTPTRRQPSRSGRPNQSMADAESDGEE